MAEKHLFWTALRIISIAGLGCSTTSSNPPPPEDSGPPADIVSVDVPARDVPAADVPSVQDAPRTDTGGTCGAMLGGACDPVSGSGCPAGQACYVRTIMGGTPMGACDTAGRGEWGAHCTNNNDCREGFACLNTTIGGTTRACTRLCCDGDNAACRDEAHGGMAGAVCDRGLILNSTNVHICQASMRCDPMVTSNNGCGTDRPYCNVLSLDGTTSCTPLGPMPGGEGALCCTDGCQPGYICVGGPGTCDMAHPLRTCRRVCNPLMSGSDAGAQCPAAQQCVGLMERPESFGACIATMM